MKGYDIRAESGSYIRAERCGNIMDRYMVVTGTDIRADNKGQLSGYCTGYRQNQKKTDGITYGRIIR